MRLCTDFRFLRLSRSPVELDLMRSLKALFDPHDLLNRGRILSEASRIDRLQGLLRFESNRG